MFGTFIEWIAKPIEGPLTNYFQSTLKLVYQRGLFDGFVVGVLVSLLFLSRRCEK